MKLDKNHQLLAYLAKEHPSASITVLMKLCYLIDLISTKKLGKQISTFEYIRYSYGPFTQDVYTTVEDLVMSNVLLPKTDYAGGSEYITYTYSEQEDFPFDEIKGDELKLINDMVSDLKGYGAKTLTDIAYKTKPMVKLGATLGGTEGLFSKLDLSA
jgi:hypothetical protein